MFYVANVQRLNKQTQLTVYLEFLFSSLFDLFQRNIEWNCVLIAWLILFASSWKVYAKMVEWVHISCLYWFQHFLSQLTLECAGHHLTSWCMWWNILFPSAQEQPLVRLIFLAFPLLTNFFLSFFFLLLISLPLYLYWWFCLFVYFFFFYRLVD